MLALSHLTAAGFPWAYLLMSVLVFIVAYVQGLGGVGFSMFAAPVALLVSPEMVPGVLLTMGSFVALLTALREWRHIDPGLLSSGVCGRLLGAAVAAILLSRLPGSVMSLLFAGLILLAVALSISGLRIRATRRNVGVAGGVSGVMSTLASVGSPPLAIVLQHKPPPEMRAITGAISCGGAVMSLLALRVTGHYGLHDLLLGIALSPLLIAGFWLSGRTRHLVTGTVLHRWLLLLCAVSALVLV